MKFDKSSEVESVCWQMKYADYSRGKNRALINNLFNGFPPYTDEEVEENGIEVNVNFLESTRLSHDARSQFYQAFLKPGNFFSCLTDAGAVHKRQKYNNVVTKEINKVMKRSIPYMECNRSQFALNVLHGISPAGWRDKDKWRPYCIGVEDVLVPSNTLLSMENLPFFAVYRQFTAPQLMKLAQAQRSDPGWNKKLINALIKYIDRESMSLMGSNWPEIWSPEKVEERVKGDGGFYVGDQCPTIDCYDFYFLSDEGGKMGWRRRMILDAWSTPSLAGGAITMEKRTGSVFTDFKGQFLYNPGDRIYAQSREQIINWQFADLSSVAPFKYHSVRSLGFLLYSVCHLQNRMRCKFSEAVFEQLMIYFRIKSSEDSQRALSVNLVSRGFIDDSISFIPASDRYQVNTGLAQLGLHENANLIAQNSSSYTTQPNAGQQNNVEKTKFQVMAETNAMTSLVSAALLQAYKYKQPEYREIFRRFSKKGSDDPEVRTYQANCLRLGVPSAILYNPECWEQEPERVMGAGNKTLEMAIAQQLMEYRNLYDPGAQRDILRNVTLAITDDPDMADRLVPEKPALVTDSVHDAQLAAGSLLMGLPVELKDGMNHIEYVETMLKTLGGQVQKYQKQNNATFDNIMGLQNMANNISQHIAIIAQDRNEKARVKQYGDVLGKMMNVVKALAQQAAERMKAQQAQGSGVDAETQAKIQSLMMMAKVKADNASQSHAQRTAQRQIQFEMEQKRDMEKLRHQMEMEKITKMQEMNQSSLETQQELQHNDALTASEILTTSAVARHKAKTASASKPKEE